MISLVLKPISWFWLKKIPLISIFLVVIKNDKSTWSFFLNNISKDTRTHTHGRDQIDSVAVSGIWKITLGTVEKILCHRECFAIIFIISHASSHTCMRMESVIRGNSVKKENVMGLGSRKSTFDRSCAFIHIYHIKVRT